VTRARDGYDDPADPAAFRAARDVCRRHGRDLYFSSAFLPRAKRDAAHAVYAFCRMVSGAMEAVEDTEPPTAAARMRHRPLTDLPVRPPAAVDHADASPGGCCSSDPLGQRLSLIRERLNAIYDGRLELPHPAGRSQEHHVLHAFAAAVHRYQLPREHFADFAEACRQGITVRRYATWASLERYCRRSGGAAALMAVGVLGVTSSDASEFALKAGAALRLTAALRDVKRDCATGRVLLPLEDLAAFRYGERELLASVVNDNFRRLMRFQVERARKLYHEAADGLCHVAGDGSRLAAATVLVWNAALLDAIERQGYDVFSRPPAVGRGDKLRRLPLAWRLARRRPGGRRPELGRTRSSDRLAAAG
jgi:phytoene synthase